MRSPNFGTKQDNFFGVSPFDSRTSGADNTAARRRLKSSAHNTPVLPAANGWQTYGEEASAPFPDSGGEVPFDPILILYSSDKDSNDGANTSNIANFVGEEETTSTKRSGD